MSRIQSKAGGEKWARLKESLPGGERCLHSLPSAYGSVRNGEKEAKDGKEGRIVSIEGLGHRVKERMVHIKGKLEL